MSPGLVGEVTPESTHLAILASLSLCYRMTIWTHRVHFLEEQILPHWKSFTIWNAGKQGRKLYRSLTAASRHKVGPFPPYPVGHYLASPSAITSLSYSPHHHLTAGPCSPPRWWPSVTLTRTRSGRASTAMKTHRYIAMWQSAKTHYREGSSIPCQLSLRLTWALPKKRNPQLPRVSRIP